MAGQRRMTLESVSRGLDTISIRGGDRTKIAVTAARRNSATRAERGWRGVGESLRAQMAAARVLRRAAHDTADVRAQRMEDRRTVDGSRT